MNKHFRYGFQGIIAAIFVLPLVLPACILVVEDGQDRDRRDCGTEWYLEVVFYRTQTLSPSSGDVTLTFVDDTRVEGVSQCGAFNGTYKMDDSGSVSVNTLSSGNTDCSTTGPSAVFLEQFARAKSLSFESDRMTVATEGSNYLQFSGS